MNWLLPQIKKAIPKWNQKVFDFADFEDICEREQIICVEGAVRSHGEACQYSGRRLIILPKVKVEMKKWIAYHELGHYFLHNPYKSFLNAPHLEYEADLFATVALLPTFVIKSGFEEEEYPLNLLKIRGNIFQQHNI
jgi:Zn-dependent peptidase ImmA (M78 family)